MIEGRDQLDLINNCDYLMNNFKQYVVGSTYNGITIHVTGANYTVVRGILIPYKTLDDTWHLRFNIVGDINAAGIWLIQLTVTGVTFKNIANYDQAISAHSTNNPNHTCVGTVLPGTAIIDLDSTGNMVHVSCSGDVELDSRPTWADRGMRL